MWTLLRVVEQRLTLLEQELRESRQHQDCLINQILMNVDNMIRMQAADRMSSPPPFAPVIYTHSHLRPSPGFAKPSRYRRTRSPSFAEGSEYSMCDTPQPATPQPATPQPATPQLATPQPATPAESDVSLESWISEFDFEQLSELMQDDDTGCVLLQPGPSQPGPSQPAVDGCPPQPDQHTDKTVSSHTPSVASCQPSDQPDDGCLPQPDLHDYCTDVLSPSTNAPSQLPVADPPADQIPPLSSPSNTPALDSSRRPTGATPSLRPALEVLHDYRDYCNPKGCGMLAIALAQHAYFGSQTLVRSSLTGKSGPPLDQAKLEAMRLLIRCKVFASATPEVFEHHWKLCKLALSNHIKHKRQRLKKHVKGRPKP